MFFLQMFSNIITQRGEKSKKKGKLVASLFIFINDIISGFCPSRRRLR